jgi:hypothetical protein
VFLQWQDSTEPVKNMAILIQLVIFIQPPGFFSAREKPPFLKGLRLKAHLRAINKNIKQARILHSQCSEYHTG